MPKFVVERHLPGIGSRSEEELEEIAAKFQAAVERHDDGLIWIASYVAEDTMYCVFSAPNSDLIRIHGLRVGFPTDLISQASKVLEPNALK